MNKSDYEERLQRPKIRPQTTYGLGAASPLSIFSKRRSKAETEIPVRYCKCGVKISRYNTNDDCYACQKIQSQPGL